MPAYILRCLLVVNVLVAGLASTLSAQQKSETRAVTPADGKGHDSLCRILVVDRQSGWPVPLVKLRTNHGVTFVSDNAGVIAFDLPELMSITTWFSVSGDGYTVPADGFGYRGVRIKPEPGGELRVEVDRQLPGKRLGRLTGAGLFAESQRFGDYEDWSEQGILGCDSVQNVLHDGKLYWGWGDTSLARYPLGIFHMIGATTNPQPLPSFEPPVSLRYDYFVDGQSQPRAVAELPGAGPTWLNGYVSLQDEAGELHLGATYAKIKPPLEVYEIGLCVWNESNGNFERRKVIWNQTDESPQPPSHPFGHPIRCVDDDDREWLLFGDPFPTLRCRATFEAWQDPKQWEELEAQQEVPVYGKDRNSNASDRREEQSEPMSLRPHRGAIGWCEYRRKWIAIFTQLNGESSRLGEIWYAESDSPFGPWGNAVHVVTHDRYSFYNPQLHLGFTPSDSPIVLFEATYTRTFSNTSTATPRFDYNQILYRLDLDEPAFRFQQD